MTTKLAELNRNNLDSRQDNFYVEFYGLPENMGNLLGRQVKEMTRPEFTYNMVTTRQRGATYTDHANVEFTPTSITFADDENSLTVMYLYAQLFRQRNAYAGEFDDIFAGYDNQRFGIKVQMFNSQDEPTEGYVLHGCLINGIRHSERMYSGDRANTLTVGIVCDNIDVQILDKLISLRK